MLENNPDCLNRVEIERVVGNQYNRLLRRQQDSKAMSGSKGSITADRGSGKNRGTHPKFEGNCYQCGKKDNRPVDYRSAKNDKSRAANDKKEGSSGGATSAGVRST